MLWLYIFSAVLLALIIAVFAVGAYFVHISVIRGVKTDLKLVSGNDSAWEKTQQKIREDSDKMYALPHGDAEITSFDGLKLAAKAFPAENCKRWVICVHGFKSSGENDFASTSEFYHSHGFSMLVINQRGHGRSEGKFIDFGTDARFDIKSWAEYLVQTYGDDIEILLDGVSMGASTVMFACGLDLPENVKCAVADCGYTSMWDIFSYLLKTVYKLPNFPLLPAAELVCKLRTGFGFHGADTRKALALSKIPVFFAHGSADIFVPTYMSRESYDACASPKELFIVDGATHGMSYIIAKDEYEKRLTAFAGRFMKL